MASNDVPPFRYLPDERFPDYTYVPGITPHPHSLPTASGQGETTGAPGRDWWRSAAFLRGVDLFNHGYYWEAHEAWEAVWLRLGRTGTEADLIKGMIKLAAAQVKLLERNTAGRRRHAQRGHELLSGVQRAIGESRYRGLDLEALKVLAVSITQAEELPANVEVGWHVEPKTKPILLIDDQAAGLSSGDEQGNGSQ